MANENGIIFIDASETPHIGISVSDCQTVFGTSRNTFGDVITNEGINKWAKYKPIKRSGLHFSDQINADFTWKDTATWWKGTDGQCGLTFTTFNSLGTNTMSTSVTFFHDLLAGLLSWGYERPTGGINQFPFRRRDFNYYYHNAPKPIAGVYDNLRIYGGGKLTVQLDDARAGADLGVQMDDITIGNSPVSGFYVGVLIWRSNSQYTFAFSESTIGGVGNLEVEFTNMTAYGGQNATVVPFLSSVRSSQGIDPGAGIFLSCDAAPQIITVGAEVPDVTMTIDAQWMETLHVRVHYAVNIINNTGSQITVNNLVIALYDGSQNVDTDTIGSVTIPANTAHEESGVLFLQQAYDASLTYEVVVSSSRSEVNGREEVNEPRNS